MSKRSADDAGLTDPQNEVDHNDDELEEDNDNLDEVRDQNGEEEGDGSSGSSPQHSDDEDGDGSDTPDSEYIRGFALSWLEDKRVDGLSPQAIFESLGMKTVVMDNMELSEQWELLETVITSERVAHAIFRSLFTPHRHKLPNINTFDDVVNLIDSCNNIVILTGAGVSVSCGIPDFRSPGGLYSVIEEKYNLPEPQCLFDIHYLRDDPKPFFEFAREIFPGQHKPSPTHYFIKELAQRGKLLRNYTQNIDTLEYVAGIDANKLVNCHGSFATASCMMCKRQVDGEKIREDIMKGTIPICEFCLDSDAFMKPDIVFFGESLPDRFDDCLKEDIEKIDLLLVMGSSLKVKPVAFVPEVIKAEVPQVLVNRELVGQPHEFDYANLGDCDHFVVEICKRLNWTLNGLSPDSYPSPPPPPTPTISTPAQSTLTISSSSSTSSTTTSVSASGASLTVETSTSITTKITTTTNNNSNIISPLQSPTMLSLPSMVDPSFEISDLDSIPAPGPLNL